MTTVNEKGGLIPVGILGNATMRHRTVEMPIASAYGTSIFKGDVVTLNAGNIERVTQASFTAGTAIGVFMGCHYTDPGSGKMKWTQFWTASTVASDAVATICDDPNQVFTIQGDAVLTAAALGKNINLVQTSAGSTTTGRSGCNVASSGVATTNTLHFRIVGLWKSPDNAWTDTFPKVRVIMNPTFHAYSQTTGL
jgi:hypothetical protein